MIGLLLPCSPMDKKQPDYGYEDEYEKYKALGYLVYLINIEDLDNSKIYPQLDENIKLIYRGWMLSEENYQKLEKATNNQLLINSKQYLYSHHLPNWYNEIADLTISSFITNEKDVLNDFNILDWKQAFIKDYVKSLKTGKGSIVYNIEDIQRALQDMKQYKGFIEGGIVLREVIDLQPHTETRFFIFNGAVYSNEQIENNTLEQEKLNIAKEVAKKHDALFFSVDIAQDNTGKLWVIEIGDGQVSDYVGWDLNKFANIFQNIPTKTHSTRFKIK